MEAMETIHAVALDVFHYFYSQATLILMLILMLMLMLMAMANLILLFLREKHLRLSPKWSQHHQSPS
jgi:hypothetical protein